MKSSMRTKIATLGFLVVGITLSLPRTGAATTLASEAKKGVAEGSAKVDVFAATVLAFGGKRTTAVAAASPCGAGCVEVTFTGNYPTDIALDKVIVNSTAVSANFGVTNAVVSSVSPTAIVVDVSEWKSDDLSPQNGQIWVSVSVGK
jgi:hypothetical protein